MAANAIRRGKAFSQSRIRELRELVMDGFSNNEIMRAMGMTATATAKAIHNHARDIRRARRENGCTLSCRASSERTVLVMIEFSTTKKMKSRKQRKCSLCRETIEVGERYARYSGKYEGDFFDEKYHIGCYNLIGEYCLSTGENEYDDWCVMDWIADRVCSDCPKHHDDTCTGKVFRCSMVLDILNCSEVNDNATD